MVNCLVTEYRTADSLQKKKKKNIELLMGLGTDIVTKSDAMFAIVINNWGKKLIFNFNY